MIFFHFQSFTQHAAHHCPSLCARPLALPRLRAFYKVTFSPRSLRRKGRMFDFVFLIADTADRKAVDLVGVAPVHIGSV